MQERNHSLLRTPPTINLEPPQNANTNDILVKEIDDHVAIARVGPMSMYEQQTFQESELANCEIGRVDGLQTFFAGNTYTNVGGL